MNRRLWLASGGVAVGALAAGAWWSQASRPKAAAGVDGPPWNETFQRLDGSPLAMSEFRGRPLVLNFWATWCEPCIREMPSFDRFARAFTAKGWQVVGLAIDQAAKVNAFLQHTPVSYTIAIANPQGLALGRALGNTQGALPFTVVFAADGRVLATRAGETRYEELVNWATGA